MSAITLRLAAALVLLAVLAIVLVQLIGVAGGVLAVILSAVAAVVIARLLSADLGRVAAAARSMAAGNYAVRLQGGAPDELSAAFNAMAEQVQLQMSAASQERSRLAAALNSSIDAVVALDRSGRVLFANLAAESLLGADSSRVVGGQVGWLLPDEGVVEAVRASRDRATRSVNVIDLPGHRSFQVVTTPIIDGGDWGILLVLHDVTDVERTEQMRRDFVANVSHELRTPLAGIKSVIETLAEGALDDPEVAADFLERADAEVDRLIQLVEELLELSRIESGQVPLSFRDTDIDNLIRGAVRRLETQAERKHLTISLDIDPGVGWAQLDPVRVERALINLLHNAIKFTPDNGAVNITAHREGEELRIVVTDTGTGIDPEDIPRVFERFYKVDQSRTSGGGSGIGLAIVKHTVEAHGGSVTLRSERGKGSEFTVILPVRPVSQPAV